MAALYTCTTFLAALLLFSVQPLVARLMLPSLGGSPSVWNTAMVFFQAVLLGGYLYSHQIGKHMGRRRNVVLAIHAVVLVLPFIFLPLALPQGTTPPATAMPVLWLLGLLAMCVGVPFFVVSTSSPLLQRMFALTGHRDAHDPYFLYAASNAGSLIALLAYPILIEPNLPLGVQTKLWAMIYMVLVVCVWVCLLLSRNSNEIDAEQKLPVAEVIVSPLPWSRRLRWIMLAFVPSSLMLSVTTYLSSEVVAIPLMWVVPLALYLLSFMVVFAKWQPISLSGWTRALIMLLLPMIALFAGQARDPLIFQIFVHLVVFFVAAVVCHGAMAKDRPPASQLTEFYGWMALGGVLGGGFNALLAPMVFRDVTEYAITLVLLCLLLPREVLVDRPELSEDKRAQAFGLLDVVLPVIIGAVCFGLIKIVPSLKLNLDAYSTLALTLGIPALLCFPLSRQPIRFGLAIAAILTATSLANDRKSSGILAMERSFFGIHRVSNISKDFRQLAHGATLHGAQRRRGDRRMPLTYYSKQGPIGDVYKEIAARRKNLRVAAIGLGAGTLAAYIEPGQDWTFYEIDPLVADIAKNPAYFTYWSDAPVEPKLVLGDARLRLKEAADHSYDLIVLDAYSSDTIPVHLITREATELYQQKLAPGGIIAWHISNKHFDLEPVIGRLTEADGWACRTRRDVRLKPELRAQWIQPSHWIAVAKTKKDLGKLNADSRWRALRTNAPLWTDDFSSLWAVLWRPESVRKVRTGN